MSRWGNGARAAFVVGSLLAGVVGWFAASHVGASDHAGTAAGTVNIYSCPMQGAVSIGQLHTGDAVWVIGVSDHRWAVIRHPSTPDRPGWVPLEMIHTDGNVGALPELGCDTNPATGTTAPVVTTPTASTGLGATTTTSATTSTTTTTLPPTTLPTDKTPPVVNVTVDHDLLFVAPASTKCVGQDKIIITVAVSDPSLPLQIASVSADWPGAGATPPVNLQTLPKNQFSMVITGNGPTAGDVPLTITVTARDGANNIGTGTITIKLGDPATHGCL